MKLALVLTSLWFTVMPCLGEFRVWTNSDGQSAELELRSVKEHDGEKVGSFGMKSGRSVRLKRSQLSAEDAKLLDAWKPSEPDAFGEVLEDDLVILDDGRLQNYDHVSPKKYYMFYYTASWCGPCVAFTPTLVKWYDEHKSDAFEIILISSDRDKSDMLSYAKGKKMKWPHLKMSKVKQFKNKFKHPGGGIPNLVLCDLRANVIKSSYEKGAYIGPHEVMRHLDGLLSK